MINICDIFVVDSEIIGLIFVLYYGSDMIVKAMVVDSQWVWLARFIDI